MTEITSYYIDENNTLHTYINNNKYVTISNVMSDDRAEELIDELNKDLNY